MDDPKLLFKNRNPSVQPSSSFLSGFQCREQRVFPQILMDAWPPSTSCLSTFKLIFKMSLVALKARLGSGSC